MFDSKLTKKDIIKWCSSHYCNEHDCKYMKDCCHIEEYIVENCKNCKTMNCKYCDIYK